MEEIKKVPMTAALVLINTLVFLILELTGGADDTMHMLEWGAAYTPAILEGDVYRLFTSMFLHFNSRHLVNNMLVLFVLGGRLEQITGKIRFLVIYLLGGIVGNLLSLYLELQTCEFAVSAGASGAVFAVMGAMIYALLRHRGRVEDLSVRQIIIMAALSLYLGFTDSNVDNAAHVGGLFGGFLSAVLLYHPRKSLNKEP